MAESVVKLRVDSQEYDAKIRRAADGLRAFGENCQRAGESVSKADKDVLDYVRSIGQMDTVAKNTKGKINEMTSAFTELSVQYKNLTDEEKKSPFGQALSQSLEQLRTRINDSKTQLSEVNVELGNTSSQSNETGGVLDALAGKFGLNVTQAGALTGALGLTTAATNVAKDAFFNNEQQLDEWGRFVDSCESVYRGFLNALNNGDISGYLAKIDTIVKAARDAYDALDELATYNAFNQINVAKTRAALSNSINDYREGSGSKDDVKKAGDAVVNELKTRQSKEQKAYEAAVGKLAAERGVSQRDLLDALSGTYGHYGDIKNVMPTKKVTRKVWTGATATSAAAGSSPYTTVTDYVPANRKEELGQALRNINDTELQTLQNLGAQAERTAIEIEGVNRQVIRVMNGRQPGTGGGSGGGGRGGRVGTGRGGRGGGGTPPPPEGSIAAQEKKVQDLTKAWRNATDEAGREGYAGQLEEAKKLLDEMQGKEKEIIPEGSFKDLNNQLQELKKNRELLADPIDVAILDQDIANIKERIDELNGVIKPSNESVSLEEKIRTSIADSITSIDEATLTNLMEFMIRNGLEDIDIGSDWLQQAIFGERMDIPDEYWQNLADKINEKLKEMGIDPISIDTKTGNVSNEQEKKEEKVLGDYLGEMAGGISSITGGLEDLGIKVPDGISKVVKYLQATQAILTGISTVVTVIMAIQSAKSVPIIGFMLAGGGVVRGAGGLVGGRSFSGDNVPALLNSGEVVLNRAEVGVIANALNNGGIGNLNLSAEVSAEKLRFVLNNNGRRTGRGEIAYSH